MYRRVTARTERSKERNRDLQIERVNEERVTRGRLADAHARAAVAVNAASAIFRASLASASATFLPLVSVPVPIGRRSDICRNIRVGRSRVRLCLAPHPLLFSHSSRFLFHSPRHRGLFVSALERDVGT